MDWYYTTVYSISGALILIAILGIIFSSLVPIIDKWNKRYLVILFIFQLLCLITCFFDAIMYGKTEMIALEKINLFLETVFLLSIVVMPSMFLSHYIGEKLKNGLLASLAIVFAFTDLALLIIAQFTDIFYSLTDTNELKRGFLFPLLIAPIIVIILIDIIGVIVIRKKLSKGFFITFLIYLPLLLVTIFVHMFYPIEFVVVLVIGAWSLTMLILIVLENAREYLKQQKEIANKNTHILVLQMRPHFIYNTMTSIYYLCEQDPLKAKEVTYNFTTYLRKNFAAIASEETISFTDELEHTRAYCEVEKAQFEDSLFIEFDTPHTMFKLPPLTLQPIVENAVKHGMVSSNKPIHILVKTRKTDVASEIIVEDDGPGYQPKDDNEPHVALNNIRKRLEIMCRGTLEISSGEKGGTLVRVTIPLK